MQPLDAFGGEERARRLVEDRRLAKERIHHVGRLHERLRAIANRVDGEVDVRRVQPARVQERVHALRVVSGGRQVLRLQMIEVDREELLRIELAVAAPALRPIERRDQLAARQPDLALARRPPESREIVEHRIG